MALQVWMPLIKQELTQQGLSSGTLSGTPKWGQGGKISEKCFRCDGPIITTIDGLKNVTTFSIAYWLYVDSSISTFTNYTDFFELQATSGNTTTVIRDELRTNTANLGRHAFHMIKNASVGSNTNTYYGLGERDDAKDKWCHVVVTKDANYCDAYADGVRYAHVACSNFESSPCKLTGVMQLGMAGCTSGYLQDFRVYDHVLSQIEIKELSKGLVLHYPLNRGGWGQENLLSRYVVPGQAAPTSTAAGGRTTWLGDYKITIPATENADTYFRLFTTKQLTTNATYTISCNVDGLLSGSYYRFPLYAQGNTAMGVLNLDHNGLCSLTFTMTYGTQTAATGANGETVYICFMDDSSRAIASGQGAITISNFKLEEGSIATPWCPNSSDALATTMGLNGTTEYDCSGYCNNGTRVGTFEWTSDTPKYSVSTEFSGSNYIKTLPTWIMQGAKECTVSIWSYMDNWNNFPGRMYSCVESGGFNTELSGKTNIAWAVNTYSNAEQTTYGYQSGTYNTVALSTLSSGWHMFTWVYTTTAIKAYIDGVLKDTKTFTTYGIHFNTNALLVIGGESAGTSVSSPYFIGKQSDFRIYATALSASDVKSLYQNCATIDPDGTIRGQIRS